MKRIILLIMITLPLFSSTRAATPEYFVTRGRVVNQELQAIPGAYEIRATLWDNADAPEDDINLLNQEAENNALWREYHSVQIMQDGKFELRIGSQLGLPNPFNMNTFEYLQLDVRQAGQVNYQIMDPLPFHPHIDRMTVASLPAKMNGNSGNGGGNTNYVQLNSSGELDMNVIPLSLRTTLSSLESNVLELEIREEENTENISNIKNNVQNIETQVNTNTTEISNIQNDVSDIAEEWETRWDIEFTESINDAVSLVTSLASRLNNLEDSIDQHGEALDNYIDTLPGTIETTVDNLLQDNYATKEELKALTIEGLNSPWKDPLYAGGELASNEDSSIGDVQFIVDEKKLASFDGNGWNRMANEKDLEVIVENTVQKTFYYHNEIIAIERNKSAQAGLFYWDKDKSMYFVGMADGSLRSLFTEGSGESPVVDWTDFRTLDMRSITLQLSNRSKVKQNSTTGIKLSSTKKRSNCALALPDFIFEKSENKTYEAVFYTGKMKGQILLGLMDGETPPVHEEFGASNNTALGLYMYLKEDSNLFYSTDQYGVASYELFDLLEEWEKNSYYRLSFNVPSSSEQDSIITVVEVSADDFETPIKTIVNHEYNFSGLSDTVKPFLLGTGNPNYSLVAIRTY